MLLDTLNRIPDWTRYIEGKTIAGTSAGADMLAKYAYGLDRLVVLDCLGILPLKFIPHWQSDYNAPNINWHKAYQELKEYKEDLEIVTLKEGEFKVIVQ